MDLITLTDMATKKVKELNKDNLPYLRVGVKGGGCSGYAYQMGFDDKKDEKDTIVEQDNISIVVDPKSIIFLAGTQLDYVENLMGSGFTFNNPNSKSTCGCGESFSV